MKFCCSVLQIPGEDGTDGKEEVKVVPEASSTPSKKKKTSESSERDGDDDGDGVVPGRRGRERERNRTPSPIRSESPELPQGVCIAFHLFFHGQTKQKRQY